LQDPAVVQNILGSLPGVDVNDPRIQAALAGQTDAKKDDDNKQDKKPEDKK